jgi:hypothetical protein
MWGQNAKSNDGSTGAWIYTSLSRMLQRWPTLSFTPMPRTEPDAQGETHHGPSDVDIPEIGDEVAAARALRRRGSATGRRVRRHRGG